MSSGRTDDEIVCSSVIIARCKFRINYLLFSLSFRTCYVPLSGLTCDVCEANSVSNLCIITREIVVSSTTMTEINTNFFKLYIYTVVIKYVIIILLEVPDF